MAVQHVSTKKRTPM